MSFACYNLTYRLDSLVNFSNCGPSLINIVLNKESKERKQFIVMCAYNKFYNKKAH